MSEMNSLDELQKLYVKEHTVMIPINPEKGEVQAKITLKAIGLEDVGLFKGFDKDLPMEDMAKLMRPFIAKSMGTTEDVVEKFAFAHLIDLFEEISKINKINKISKVSESDKLQNLLNQKRQATVTHENAKQPDTESQS